MNKRELGKAGESLAAEYLQQNGYRILYRNYWCKVGEIDLIAQKNDCVHFVEVKTRSSGYYGHPSESITQNKLNRMRAAAAGYMKAAAGMPGLGRKMQIDVIEVRIDYIENV